MCITVLELMEVTDTTCCRSTWEHNSKRTDFWQGIYWAPSHATSFSYWHL